MLFVTHDIREALHLGTMVLVMADAAVQQYAAPDTLLSTPANAFVRQLVHNERSICHLPDDHLTDCDYSGAALAAARKEFSQ